MPLALFILFLLLVSLAASRALASWRYALCVCGKDWAQVKQLNVVVVVQGQAREQLSGMVIALN